MSDDITKAAADFGIHQFNGETDEELKKRFADFLKSGGRPENDHDFRHRVQKAATIAGADANEWMLIAIAGGAVLDLCGAKYSLKRHGTHGLL